MVGGFAGIRMELLGTRWSGPAACAWPSRFRVEMPARSQRCQRVMRPEMIAKNVQKSKLVKGIGLPERIECMLLLPPEREPTQARSRLCRGSRLCGGGNGD